MFILILGWGIGMFSSYLGSIHKAFQSTSATTSNDPALEFEQLQKAEDAIIQNSEIAQRKFTEDSQHQIQRYHNTFNDQPRTTKF